MDADRIDALIGRLDDYPHDRYCKMYVYGNPPCECHADLMGEAAAALREMRDSLLRLQAWETRAVASMDYACAATGAKCCDEIPAAVREMRDEIERLKERFPSWDQATVTALRQRAEHAEAERDALRQVIRQAAGVMRGDGVEDQGQAWDMCLRILDAAIAESKERR